MSRTREIPLEPLAAVLPKARRLGGERKVEGATGTAIAERDAAGIVSVGEGRGEGDPRTIHPSANVHGTTLDYPPLADHAVVCHALDLRSMDSSRHVAANNRRNKRMTDGQTYIRTDGSVVYQLLTPDICIIPYQVRLESYYGVIYYRTI